MEPSGKVFRIAERAEVASESIEDQRRAGELSDPADSFHLEALRLQKPGHGLLIEKEVVLGDELAPAALEQPERHGVNVRRLQHQQAAGAQPCGNGSKKLPR